MPLSLIHIYYENYVADKKVTDVQALDRLLQTCALDDLEGNLVTSGGRSLPRKSVVEFSWVVGLPEVTLSLIHISRLCGKRLS